MTGLSFLEGATGERLVLLLLFLGLALAFEFVNGFHDTANAVATVIYTNALRPRTAVVLSGICNFVGVHLGGTAVAFSIVYLLPVDLLVVDRIRGRHGDGARALVRGHRLELRDVVSGAAGLELAHVDRLDPRASA